MNALLRCNVAVLFSERSRHAYAAQAQRLGEIYRFTAATGTEREWLKGEYAYLAPNAASSVLHRWGIKHDLLREDDLAGNLDAYQALVVPNAGHLAESDIARIADWLRRPESFLVVTGKTNLPPDLLGLVAREPRSPAGYTGWQWTPDSPFGDPDAWDAFYVSSYCGYECAMATADENATVLADLLEVTGDLSSPSTALTLQLGAAIVATVKTLYVANQVFEYLGGVLQAHINVEDVRPWSNPTHWGDTLAFFLREVLRATPARRLWDVTLRPFGAYDGVLQLRHDVDHEADESIDFSMLDFQAQNAVPASYYLMDPAFCTTRCTPMGGRSWVEATARYNFIEAAQHNDSADGDPPRWITGAGLLEHIRESDRALGIRSQTAGRHMGLLVYPETIDAMDYLYEHDPDMLGLCTFSLYDVIAYGERNPEAIVLGKEVTYTTYDPANPSVPAAISGYWFPYHAVVSTTDCHKPLRGWDVTHDTDCDYDRLDQFFAGRNSRSPRHPSRLENGVFTIQYETQLARDPRENDGRGHLPWMRYAIALAERQNFWITTKRALYKRMNDYQDVVFRVENDTLTLHNPTDRAIAGLVAQMDRPVDALTDGERHHIHVVGGRRCTLPTLAPRQTMTLCASRETDPSPKITQPNSNVLDITEATYQQTTREIVVRGHAIQKAFVLLSHLPPDQPLAVQIVDNRGTVRTNPRTRADGTVAIPVLGQQENVIAIEVTVRPA